MSAYSATKGTSFLAHHLGDDGEAALLASAGEHLEPLEAVTLECIRGAARLESAAAQDARSGAAHMVGSGEQLELGFHRAGPRHGDEFAAAHLKIEYANDGLFALLRLQSIGCIGKMVVPTFAHGVRSISGEGSD